MEIIKENGKRTLTPVPSVTIHEYDTHDDAISGAVAEIRGRYPEKGFVMNQKTKELVYVLSGNGKILTPNKETGVSVGDVVLLDRQEKYAWAGNMTMFISTAPKFDPAQHVKCE